MDALVVNLGQKGVWESLKSNDTSYREKWIKNHPSWKGIPHLVLWYYMETEEDYLEFLKHYPDVEHAPNESWKSMYNTLILK